MPLILVNPMDSNFTAHRYILWFGQIVPANVMVWEDSLDGAFDKAIDWIVDHQPDLLCDDMVKEAFDAAVLEGLSKEEAFDAAMSDVSIGGNCGHSVLSYEWGIVAEDPDRATILQLQ